MLPGPVFNVELMTTARRPRYYAFRVLYGLALLVLVWQNYASWDRFGGGLFLPQQMAAFAKTTFASMVVLQAILVVVMTPSLVAGVIANEKQRKTLHYLLASTLTSGEIVLGKLAARMLHVAVFLAIGLPVMSLLTLFGGVDPAFVVLSVAGTFTCAFFLASLSIYCSTNSKKVREAISASYAIEAAWLILPLMLSTLMPFYYPRLYGWIRPGVEWIMASTPWAPLFASRGLFRSTGISLVVEATLWMMALQVGAGIAFIALAIARLRPVFKVQEGAPASRFLGVIPLGKTRRLRLFARRPVGDHAMIWKELHTSRTSGTAQLAGLLLAIVVAAAIGYWTCTFGYDAFLELRHSSYSSEGNGRRDFSVYLRFVTTGVGLAMILAAAVGGANTMTSEREDDTWLSLVATPLSGREIVSAKMLGIFWKMRWAGLLVALLWVAGMACGAIHPMGVLFAAIEDAAFVGFAAALGTWLSLRSKSTWKSQAMTTGVLVAVMGGYLACCCPFLFQGRPSMLMLAGCVPFIQAASLPPPWEFNEYFYPSLGTYYRTRWETGEIIAACVIGTAGYAIAAALLAAASVWGFDRAADRPRRDEFLPDLPPPDRKTPAKTPFDPL